MRSLSLYGTVFLGLFLGAVAAPQVHGAEPKTFSWPEAAARALVEAARTKDREGALAILGPDSEVWIVSGDPVQDRADVERFIAAYDVKNGVRKVTEDSAYLVVGEDDYPFAIPLIKGEKGWAFDAEEGKEELLDRRVGRNELNTIQTILAIADAQHDYASVDRDGDGVLEYAPYIVSSQGERDGLWWPTEEGEPLSPLGPLVADAVREGYDPESTDEDAKAADDAAKTEGGGAAEDGQPRDESRPYHGYHFRLLTRQGQSAPGGAQDYIVGDQMIGGFAVLAYPANYGNSGVMTFMMSLEGTIYDKDLGPATDSLVLDIDSFNPGEGWKKVDPEFMVQVANQSP